MNCTSPTDFRPPKAISFYPCALRLDLQVRPVVVRGDPVPYLISQTGEEPADGSSTVNGPSWWHATKHLGVWCDGEQVGQGGGGGSGMGLTGSTTGSSVNVRTPGKHTLEVREHVEIYYGKYSDEAGSRRCTARDVSLKAEFELLPEGAARICEAA